MLQVRSIVVGQLQSNCFLVIDDDTKEAIIIDPGDDAEYIISVLHDEQAKPTQIIATHGHFDHIMAAAELQLAYKIPFLIHHNDEFLVKRMRQNAKHFLNIDPGPSPKITRYLESGSKLNLKHWTLNSIHTPGHTPGSITLFNKKEGIAFVGDLLFAAGGVGRTDFSYSDQVALQESATKILELSKDTILYCGHGEKTTVAAERRYHLNLDL